MQDGSAVVSVTATRDFLSDEVGKNDNDRQPSRAKPQLAVVNRTDMQANIGARRITWNSICSSTTTAGDARWLSRGQSSRDDSRPFKVALLRLALVAREKKFYDWRIISNRPFLVQELGLKT
jgi:hypothetical protein